MTVELKRMKVGKLPPMVTKSAYFDSLLLRLAERTPGHYFVHDPESMPSYSNCGTRIHRFQRNVGRKVFCARFIGGTYFVFRV